MLNPQPSESRMISTHTIKLPARLGLGEVNPLIAELSKTSNQDVDIDTTEVTHLGTLCLQALIAAARAHKAAGTAFSFRNTGKVFTQQLAVFGLTCELVQGGLE